MKKVYILPNLVTTIGMGCGFFSIIRSINFDYVEAAWLIIIAGLMDGLDGRIARFADATSEFGSEYDSLADLVSFGIAPSIMVYIWALQTHGREGGLVALLFVVCGALRLARFNVTSETLPKGIFLGMPIPIAAVTLATYVIFSHEVALTSSMGEVDFTTYVPWMTLVCAGLMVSSIPFPSFKSVNWKTKAGSGYLLIGLLATNPSLHFFILVQVYVFGSLLWGGVSYIKQRTGKSVQAVKGH